MTLRFHSYLLSAFFLVLLGACGTTGQAPVARPTAEQEQPVEAEVSDSQVYDLQYQLQREPSDRSLQDVIELSRHMTGYQPEVALAVLRSLESIPSGELTTMIDSQIYDPEFTEWLELALQSRSLLINQNSLPAAAQNWADYHWGHAITQADFIELIYTYRSLFPVPARVAVLLPAKGGLSSAARAIRDGILSAYLEHPGDSTIRFYSSGTDSKSVMAAYLQAREDGATQIIGPLRSASAGTLASLDNPGIPILLLNDPAEYQPSDPDQETVINSLTLSQTEEAMAVAESALLNGQNKVIIIVQDSAWGRRNEAAFATRFEQGEGRISDVTHFNASLEEHN